MSADFSEWTDYHRAALSLLLLALAVLVVNVVLHLLLEFVDARYGDRWRESRPIQWIVRHRVPLALLAFVLLTYLFMWR